MTRKKQPPPTPPRGTDPTSDDRSGKTFKNLSRVAGVPGYEWWTVRDNVSGLGRALVDYFFDEDEIKRLQDYYEEPWVFTGQYQLWRLAYTCRDILPQLDGYAAKVVPTFQFPDSWLVRVIIREHAAWQRAVICTRELDVRVLLAALKQLPTDAGVGEVKELLKRLEGRS